MQDKLWLSTISVGRELVLMPYGNFARTAGGRTPITRTVTKVGKKYFYIGNDAFSRKTGEYIDRNECNGGYVLYPDMAAYEEAVRTADERSAIKKIVDADFTDTTHSVAGEHTLSRMRLSMRYTAFWLSAVLSKPVRRRESLMAKAQNSLPPEETRYPGVSITARDGAHYAITQRRDDGHTPTFTLWSVSEDGGYAKLKSSTDYDALGSLIF